MKFLILTLLTLMVSCVPETVNNSTENDSFGGSQSITYQKLMFEGHSYIFVGQWRQGGLTHDMNCKCVK